jgi:hypothetical protein
METMTQDLLRNALSCDRCGEWFFTDSITRGDIVCPICAGKVTRRGFVKPDRHAYHDEQRSVCDARCTDANGVKCDCSCQGRNHGSRRVVTVEVRDGIVTLGLDSDRTAALAAKRLPEIERSEQLRDACVARLEVVFAADLAKSREGGWMPHDQYLRIEQWRQFRAAIRHAMALKVPRNRVKALEKVAVEIEGFNR